MNRDINPNTKLGEVYKNLLGLNLTVEDMDLPVSVRNYLKQGGVHHLQQILSMSETDLMNFNFARRNCAYLMSWLTEESKRRECAQSVRVMNDEKQFNIFAVAKIWKSEEIHTSIIAELINPRSAYHDYGQAFLDLFLQTIGLSKDDFIGATIATEVRTTENRRIDLVISSKTHYVPFEVKIWAKDQPNQLKAYYDFAKNTGKQVPFVVYLTPTEREPSVDSRGQGIDLQCITFEKHILPWLEQCMDCNPPQDVLEILNQLHHNIQKNIVRNTEHPLLTAICANKALENLEAGKTECTPKYRTYTLNKLGILEVALRIELKDDDHVKLVIICGIEDNGKPNYAIAYTYISETPEEFTRLMNSTFAGDIEVDRNPERKKWGRLQRFFCRKTGETSADFAARCGDGIAEILTKCTVPATGRGAALSGEHVIDD